MYKQALPELRRLLGLSQNDLAARMGYTRETICRWEQGRAAIPYHAERAFAYFAQAHGLTYSLELASHSTNQWVIGCFHPACDTLPQHHAQSYCL